jgi:hypothetical protein
MATRSLFTNASKFGNARRSCVFLCPVKSLRLPFFCLWIIIAALLAVKTAVAQPGQPANPLNSRASTTPQIHYDFPFQMMWDDAVLTSVKTKNPALAFDLDLIDSNSIRLAREVIENKRLQTFIKGHFEPAMNDFATDPPPSVGLDSLRNLGWRLSGLEKDYIIPFRPTIIVIGPDKQEIDRIVHPETMTPQQLESRLTEILKGKKTIGSAIADFWRDTTSIPKRQVLVSIFEGHSKYDSVMYHLEVLRRLPGHDAQLAAALKYVDLKLHVEGDTKPLDSLMTTLGAHGRDSALHYNLLDWKLKFYQGGKRVDSVSAMFDRILAFIGVRDPELLNEYAWHLATYVRQLDTAMALVNEAIQHDRHNPNFYDTRAFIYYRQNKLTDAIHSEEDAIRYATDDKQYFENERKRYRELKLKAEESEKKP